VLVSAAVAVMAAYAIHVALWKPLPVSGFPFDAGPRTLGVVHVHTTFSDGGGAPGEVIASARAAGLGFVAITDHGNLDAKSYEGYRDGVLVLVGSEASTDAGHIVGLGIPDPTFRFSTDARDTLQDISDLGGHSFAAHPTSSVPTFRWTGWELPGPWGIEVLSGDTQWRSAGAWRLLRTATLYGLNQRYALLSSLTPPTEALSRWDALLRERDAAAILGTDAHSHVVVRKETAVRFPSYRSLFELARNHVLLDQPLSGNAESDSRAVVAALAGGRSYVGVDALALSDGFCFQVEGTGHVWRMGETAPAAPGLRLRAGGGLPSRAVVRVLRDGQALQESAGSIERADVQPGVYRVEVRLPGWSAPWVVSNPIYVFAADVAAARRKRVDWPEEPVPPAAADVLDRFEGVTPFEIGHDSSSSVEPPLLDAHGGEDGRGAARLRFRLGTPTPAHPHTFCAIVDRTGRDLTGRQGLVFSIRGDGVYRIRVEVRDDNPRSADEGTEWWFASVKTSKEWRRVSVPFARFRSINPSSDGRLDLDKVRAIVFVIDRGEDKVGTEGTIWIDDLGVY
jgi:Carbohydrate binding domain (family 11)